MKTIYLVRHGKKENIDSHSSIEKERAKLTPEGLTQAKHVAKYFSKLDIQLIASSHLMRSIQTAEVTASMKRLTIIEDSVFRERVLFVHDMDDQIAKLEFDRCQTSWLYNAPGAESIIGAVNRFELGVKKFASSLEEGRSGVIFSHGRVIQSFLHLIDNSLGLGGSQLIIENCSISMLTLNDETQLFVDSANQISHLI